MIKMVPIAYARWPSRTRFAALLCIACAVSLPGHANNAACWGMDKDDPSRPDISCTKLTERLLLSLRGASRAEVEKTMNAPGITRGDGRLHYLSNATTYSGDVDVTFKNGRAIIVYGVVQPTDTSKNLEFIWNGEDTSLCSDVPGSRNRCDR
jgi:hypothetical protein